MQLMDRKGYLTASLNYMVQRKPEDLAVIRSYAAQHPENEVANAYVANPLNGPGT